MAIITDKHTGLKFVEPETWQEGLARLLAADAYRANPNIGFGESGLVDHEINFLHKWCAKALRPERQKRPTAPVRPAHDAILKDGNSA
jgi:hypothetical protein